MLAIFLDKCSTYGKVSLMVSTDITLEINPQQYFIISKFTNYVGFPNIYVSKGFFPIKIFFGETRAVSQRFDTDWKLVKKLKTKFCRNNLLKEFFRKGIHQMSSIYKSSEFFDINLLRGCCLVNLLLAWRIQILFKLFLLLSKLNYRQFSFLVSHFFSAL